MFVATWTYGLIFLRLGGDFVPWQKDLEPRSTSGNGWQNSFERSSSTGLQLILLIYEECLWALGQRPIMGPIACWLTNQFFSGKDEGQCGCFITTTWSTQNGSVSAATACESQLKVDVSGEYPFFSSCEEKPKHLVPYELIPMKTWMILVYLRDINIHNRHKPVSLLPTILHNWYPGWLGHQKRWTHFLL